MPKVATVLVIASGVFAYYLDSLRPDRLSVSRNRLFAMAALAVAAFGIGTGFVQLGSPAGQRAEAQDAHRLSDLSSLARAAFTSVG